MVITPATKSVGLIGHPVAHSASPLLHNRLYNELDIDMVYSAFDVSPDYLPSAVEGLAALGFIGFNVTIPYKEKIMEYLDEIDEEALVIGAVNTVKINKGRLLGYNTDGQGFMESLKRVGISARDKKVLIIGAGGSARAVAVYIARDNPHSIKIHNRTTERAISLSNAINEYAGKILAEYADKFDDCYDIIVNTTSVGMWPDIDGNPLSGFKLKGNEIVCDIVYNPHMTAMQRNAMEKGCTIVYGIDMLIGQGLRSVEIWTGRNLPYEKAWDVMMNAIKKLKK